jgi:hypothetical protein
LNHARTSGSTRIVTVTVCLGSRTVARLKNSSVKGGISEVSISLILPRRQRWCGTGWSTCAGLDPASTLRTLPAKEARQDVSGIIAVLRAVDPCPGLPHCARRPRAATGAAPSNRPCERCAPPLRALGVAAVDVLFTAETRSTRRGWRTRRLLSMVCSTLPNQTNLCENCYIVRKRYLRPAPNQSRVTVVSCIRIIVPMEKMP